MTSKGILQTIRQEGLFAPGDRVVVGVSGGPDSVCLLHALVRLSEELDLRLTAVHVHHGLRGAEADRDQAYTEALCRSLGVECRVFARDVRAMAEAEGIGTEEAGRLFRYECFERVRSEIREVEGADAPVRIAVAQNRNDRAETVLFRLLRGTGPDGLAAMDAERADGIVRPLLSIERTDIEAYCRAQGLTPCIDRSNREPVYARNRIRLELLPLLARDYNPDVIAALDRLSRIAAEDRAYFAGAVEDLCRETDVLESGRLSRRFYAALPPSLGKRLVARILREQGLLQDLAAIHLDNADQLLRSGRPGSRAVFPKGYRMVLTSEEGRFSKERSKESRSFEQPVRIPGTTTIPGTGDILICTRLSADPERARRESGPNKVFIDWTAADGTAGELTVRSRRPGDRFSPLGLAGTRKVQDVLVDAKVPRDERDRIPLLCDRRGILWIAGVRAGEPGRVTPGSKAMLCVEYHRTL